MDFDTSLIVLAAAIAATLAGWFGDRARRRAPLAAHALLPWHAVMFVGMTFALVMIVHLLGMARGQ